MNPSIQKLAQLMQARQEQGEAPYVLLLGSSLSLTPAVRRAFAETEDWEAFWKAIQRASLTERKALLKKPLDALGLELGYQAMARLAEAGYFNLVLTLNVDDAIDDAVRPLPADQSVLLIYDGSNTVRIVEALSRPTPRVKVVKLRGDINAQALPLTATGQFEFPDDLERSVSEWLKRDTILVGDIPYDTDVQRCIKRSRGALWCVLPEEPTGDRFVMRARQSRPSGETIIGSDAEFNTFFTALAERLLPGFLKNRARGDFRDEVSVDRLGWGTREKQQTSALAQKPVDQLATESVDQAAAICYKWKDGQIEFLLIRTSGRRWIFPKGQIEPGEPLWRTAQREAHEEAGVSGEISHQPLTIFRHLKRDLKLRGRELSVAAFLFKVEAAYEPRERQREPTWFTPEEAERVLSEDRDFDYAEELKRVVREACSAINALY